MTMKRDSGNIRIVVFLLMVAMFVPVTGYSDDIDVEFGRTHSVTVAKAKIVDQSGSELELAGQLNRPHRLPMAGHLHTYVYVKNGNLVSDSKHRVLGLNSQRGGSMRVPFRVSIKDVANEIDRVYLEYHNPWHVEI